MTTAPAKMIVLFFLCLTSLASPFARSNAIRLTPCFDSFVLFGQICPFDFKEMIGCRLQLLVELGNHVWLQNVESKYYTIDLPTRNYSGRIGRISLVTSGEHVTTLWNQSFSVQSDVGALRLDIINAGEALHTINGLGGNFQDANGPNNAGIGASCGRTMSFMAGLAQTVEGRTPNNFKKPRSKNAHFKQFSKRLQQSDKEEATCPSIASPEFHPGHSIRERKFPGELLKTEPANPQLMHIPYPQPMIISATNIQTSYLIFLVVWFAFIQLSISLVHKSILLLEVSVSAGNELAEGEVLSFNRADPGARQLCLTFPNGSDGYPFDSESTQGFKPAGKTPLEEAWDVAEQYLNEAIENDCQGAYFSYNCTTPQQEAPESALGRWNRDNAGRLIRQLWP
ncbi:hypothetical protein GOP47_0005210 [Adiantum capillus-veneris]|uniref:Uncharacterized protein n=1 Tax=Adiantum capillus-veneris TaxID=13818 RepID=A0A9D4V5K5_ADICA|nr:hypothetical protein GOP47_0005210 [Adiantum capillus-veneris]